MSKPIGRDMATSLLTRVASKDSQLHRTLGNSVLRRALICGFMVSLSFSVTQVPLIYIFRLMTCDEYYKTHPLPPAHPKKDKCSVHAIEASTAIAVSILGLSTTIFGVLNLFITGWTIAKFGVKSALLVSVFWPAVRLGIQNIGVYVGSKPGIVIIQSSQIITIVGGPAGYMLALNTFVTEVIEHEERTGALGRLQGATLFGTSIGYLFGGLISDWVGIQAPFMVTVGLFCISCAYVAIFLPWSPLSKDVAKKNSGGLARYFGPLKTFAPQKWVSKSGKVGYEYGALLLGTGIFFGILATSYIPILLQMYATDVLGFGTAENGCMISLTSLVRGLFLSLAFPRIIKIGRAWTKRHELLRGITTAKLSEETPLLKPIQTPIPDLSAEPNDFANHEIMENEEEPVEPVRSSNEQETFVFDLFYTRLSLITDGVITGCATFITQGWQMYLVAFVLPLAAGTGSAAKGTILQMCPESERVDALKAITLLEMIARLVTTSIFGLVFAGFSNIGMPNLVFTVNACVAIFGFLFLLSSRFPPDGSKRLEEHADNHDEQTS
ncbi:hypothetical protein FKW77_000795 [Venturia effusa]|uniref:Major facilitator superfamily (MFS) profile domain-containing protein n=1 Tax=Venturia effusa TaxID=50376 RepID=A0A517LKT3_9PEZI|nr:hypothetical protein FKW77_000795 [Venturia effusa]